MREKFISLSSLLLLFTLFAGCQPKEKFGWDAGISGPRHYPSGAPSVTYFYKGANLASASLGTGADQGWGITSGGFTGGDDLKPVPDSVDVKWVCGADDLVYKAGFKLPREKMLQLFKKGATDPLGDHVAYSVIIAGMAPGGNVCIWLQAGLVLTEVAKFKVKTGVDDPRIDQAYKEKNIKGWKDYLTYWKLHGIPYSVWEKGEKAYNYDIGFSSESGQVVPDITTLYSSDGSWYQPEYTEKALSSIELINWADLKFSENNNLIKERKLPVEIVPEWKYNNKYYSSTIVLPQNLAKYFSGQNNEEKYQRIVIGVSKDNKFGKIWLENKTKRKDIMVFKVFEALKGDTGYESGGYSLPKDYQFPIWGGKNKLTFPEFDYWQEH